MIAHVPILSIVFALALGGGDDLDDRELARRIKDGDRAAFRAFFDRYHGMLFGFLRRRGVPAAVCEDLTQQAFVTIWERCAAVDPAKSLRAYLFRISYSRALNHFRDNARFTDDEQLANLAGPSNPDGGAEYARMQVTLQRVLDRLPERRRAVFELCFLEELTYREAAETLDVSVKTVEHQMSAALRELRKAFEQYVEEGERFRLDE